MEQEEVYLDIRQLFKLFLKRWWIIGICVILCTAAAYSLVTYVMSPVYKASTTLYIGKNTDKIDDITYNDVMLGSQLVKDYRELVVSRMVSSTVIEQLGLKNTSASQLSGMLTVTSKNDTRVIQISTENTNPQLAMDITNRVAEIFKTRVVEIMKVENVQIIDKAELPQIPVKPDKVKNLTVAAMLGIVMGCLIIFLINYLDDTIKTPDDVTKYLDLPVIGTIPVFPKS